MCAEPAAQPLPATFTCGPPERPAVRTSGRTEARPAARRPTRRAGAIPAPEHACHYDHRKDASDYCLIGSGCVTVRAVGSRSHIRIAPDGTVPDGGE